MLTGLSSGFLVVGSLSKTSVAIAAGAKTQVSSLIHGTLVILTLIFLMPLFQNLPHATLAAIVIEAMIGLANVSYFQQLKHINPTEFYVSLLAFVCVLFLSVLSGIGVGVIAAIMLLIYRASHPGTAVLGQIPHSEMYRNMALHPEAKTIPGLLIFRFNNSIIFPNANYFKHSLKEAVQAATVSVKMVLIDAETINLIDSTSLEMLSKLQAELARKGIVLAWARLLDPIHRRMALAQLVQQFGEENFYARITDGVTDFKQRFSTRLEPED